MAKVPVYNQEGKEIGTVELGDAVFGVAPRPALVHQVYTALLANAREPWAHTKNRGEVRGGGRKPWKQKGTGRARHGSIRSPIWRGGGITFGPRNERNYTQRINKKMKQQAVRMCLSDKVRAGLLVVVESLPGDAKTRSMVALRGRLPGAGKSTLLVTPEKNDTVMRASRNIPRLHVTRAADLNVVECLEHQCIVTTKEGAVALETRLAS